LEPWTHRWQASHGTSAATAQVLPAPPLHPVSPRPLHLRVDFFYPVSPAPLSHGLARAAISSVVLTPRLRRFALGKSDSNARWTHGSEGEPVKAPYPASLVPPSPSLARATISSVLTPCHCHSVSHHYQLALASPPCCPAGLVRRANRTLMCAGSHGSEVKLFFSSCSLLASLSVHFGYCLRSCLMGLCLVAEAMKLYPTLPTYSDRIATIG
jgi:hypothetical protein